ncbi:MAG: lipid-A-disaccharide synthase [Candidatus Paraprevotella stercoravium]|jgi:lipid-A-disaccharide synthase|uniref:Lipid-A-disaccharide synthase n=1 Tax=Candidatus Paraprevotella stercoravium TaxID=2838725 RepID=A0A9E2P1Q2_9BACT|nr:lipid-A-disaccharide synthase [Candidatus Paraprevotella stercoravium]
MKYYLIAGEASGDLHAGQLMKALKEHDSAAEFRYFGGDEMQGQGGTLVRHYKDTAYMGFIPVLLHLRQIFQNMDLCKQDIVKWQPDVVILIDYPGFNLSVAEYLKKNTAIPVYYYIAPKIWAWKEHRIKNIRRDVDELFSILPFEIEFFEQKHHYPIHYVGNPSLDEVHEFLTQHPDDPEGFRKEYGLDDRPIIALLAGSRKQEIKDNLPMMAQVALEHAADYQIVLAGAPNIDLSYYHQYINEGQIRILTGCTYRILQHSAAALVTSGTATLETALFRVPQVVCYYTACGKLVSQLRKLFLKVPFVSLVNLITGDEVVPELVADQMNPERLRRELQGILPGGAQRDAQLEGYQRMLSRLGEPGAPDRAAREMIRLLRKE